MILRTYASNQPLSLLLLPVIAFSVLLALASAGRLEVYNADFPLDRLLHFIYDAPFQLSVVCSLLILGGAFLSNVVFNRHEFFNVPVFVPALIYTLLATTLSVVQLSVPVLVANIFALLGLNCHLKIFHQPKVLAEYFETGFWYGLAAVCFPPFILLIAAVWIGTIATRAFHWREYVLPIVAFGVPFAYWVSWLYFQNDLIGMVLYKKWISFDRQSFFGSLNRPSRLFALTVLLSLLFAIPRYLFLSERSSNKAKTIRTIFFIVALALSGSYFFAYLLMWKWIIMAFLLPFSFMLGYWFANYRVSLVAPFFFYAIVACSAACIVNALI
jgi:hypothetical protein